MAHLVAQYWSFAALAAVLVVSAITDVCKGKIYNAVTYSAIGAGLIGHTFAGGLAGDDRAMGLAGSAAGFAAGFGPMFAVWLMGGIGGGDAKLMGAVGALMGWRFTLEAMFLGLIVAALMAVVAILSRRVFRRTLARIFRFMYLALTPGKPADPTTPESPKIPFGLALCIGSAAALVEVILRGSEAQKLLLGI